MRSHFDCGWKFTINQSEKIARISRGSKCHTLALNSPPQRDRVEIYRQGQPKEVYSLPQVYLGKIYYEGLFWIYR